MVTGSRLSKALETYVIVLDTCFAVQEAFDAFLSRYSDILQRNHILVPYQVVEDLNEILAKHDEREPVVEATLCLLEKAVKIGIAEYRRDADDDAVINDAVIARVVERLLPRRDVLVLTHDRNLTSYLYSKTQQQCFAVKKLIVAGVARDGNLFDWRDCAESSGGTAKPPARVRTIINSEPIAPAPGPAPFGRTTRLAPSLGQAMPASIREAIKEGDSLFLKDGSGLTLRHVLASGGEGTIYELDDQSLLCKVYHRDKLTLDRQEKVGLMLTRSVSDPMICWPREAVYDSDRLFRGFLMPRASGKPVPLGHSLFIPAVFLKTHPSWTRKNSACLAATILKKIAYLHRMNVLVGDINPLNILMTDENNIFLVDCDSYQIEGYPCPVGTVNFTAPEIQGSDFRQFLRTKEHEMFSVATLLFMIFMPGKSPYSHQGGEDGAANVRKMHFPYPLGERGADAAPEGPWRLCWSHLPFTMKDAFHKCFHADHRGEMRISVEQWVTLVGKYLRLLDKQKAVFRGPKREVGFDLSILPENFRRVEINGEIKPPWPDDLRTYRERMVGRLVAEASASRTGYRGHASYGGAAASPQPAATPPQPSVWVAPPSRAPAPSFQTPSASEGGAARGRGSGRAVRLFAMVAASAILGFLLICWKPISGALGGITSGALVVSIIALIRILYLKR